MPLTAVQSPQSPFAVQFVGYKKTGKTTLVCRLVERFAADGLRVATAKRDDHTFEPDVPGTDSWKHRQAGAWMSAVVSAERSAFFEERGTTLAAVLERMKEADLVLVEGWKREAYPKLALVHREEDLALLAGLTALTGIVTWNEGLKDRLAAEYAHVPIFAYGELERMADHVRTLASLDA